MSKDNSTVVYREVPGFPGYKAGSDGSVWTQIARKGKGWRYGFDTVLTGEWRRLKEKISPSGRPIVCLFPGARWRLVSRVVLESFVGPRPEGLECCHYPDPNPMNNSIGNIRWDTKKANAKDRRLHGSDRLCQEHHDAKLTNSQVLSLRIEYRKLFDAHGSHPRGYWVSVAKRLGVSVTSLRRAILGETWKALLPSTENLSSPAPP